MRYATRHQGVARRIADDDPRFGVVHGETLRCFPELVAELGHAPEPLLREAHLDPAVLTRRHAIVEYHHFVRLLALAAERTGRPDLGLRLAERQRGGRAIGPVGVVMRNSATVGEAIGYCARHIHAYSLATRVRFRPDRAGQRLLVALELLLGHPADTRQVVEHALLLAHLNIRDLTAGAAGARQVRFRHAPQMPAGHYAERFGCEVRFGEKADGIVLTEADLLCPVADADEQLREMATSFIDDRFPRATAPVAARVRGLVMQQLGELSCTGEHIAAQLCLHPRTLQRRLRAERTSFERIKDEVRRETALRCLGEADLPLTRIAEKLGYAEVSVLSRSCSRWFEATPRQVRQRGAG